MTSDIYKQYKIPGSSGGGLYLKFEDGASVKVRLASEPHIYTDDKFGATRYIWVVFNQDEQKAQVLQLPVTGYRAVADLATDEEWGDVTSFDLKITRTGTGLDTRYSITPSPNKAPLTADQKKQVVEVDLAKAVPTARPLAEFVESEPSKATSANATGSTPDEAEDNINLDDIPF